MKKLKIKLPLDDNTQIANCRDVPLRKLFAIGVFLALITFSQAQVFSPEVVASAGASATSATCIIDWTLGEIAIETLTQSNVILTQGFQQNFISKPTAIEKGTGNEFSLFPNPVRDQIYLSFKQAGTENYLIEIVNIKGNKVWNAIMESSKNMETIDVNGLPSGIYMIRISTRQGKTLKTTKFIKL